jgi:hypothetical protein
MTTPRQASLRSALRGDPGGLRRPFFALAAAALVGAVLPVSAGAPAAGADKPAFSGFSSTAWAAPVKVEIYEPTIPIPATPQLELELGYTTVEADSGSSMGRASWLWPGDSVGEGAKTLIENLGLPPELSGPLAAQGYPVQVNANQPSGAAHQADEPFPGAVMRTDAGAKRTIAQVGFSPDGEVQDGTGGGHARDSRAARDPRRTRGLRHRPAPAVRAGDHRLLGSRGRGRARGRPGPGRCGPRRTP